MSFLFDRMAEERIQAAIRKGELDNLPGRGAPLKLEDDSMVPAELRLGYRILKNAGYLPPELDARNQALNLCQLLAHCKADSELLHDTRQQLRQLELKLRIKGMDTRFIHRYLQAHPQRNES
ncbi:MAG: DnaJ family domain-containing protein [Aeromonas sp.]